MKNTYTLFEKLVSEVNAAIVTAPSINYANQYSREYNGGFFTFRITKTMYKIRGTKENLTSFLQKITLKRRFMTDSIFAAPAIFYVEKMSAEDHNAFKHHNMSHAGLVAASEIRERDELLTVLAPQTPQIEVTPLKNSRIQADFKYLMTLNKTLRGNRNAILSVAENRKFAAKNADVIFLELRNSDTLPVADYYKSHAL